MRTVNLEDYEAVLLHSLIDEFKRDMEKSKLFPETAALAEQVFFSAPNLRGNWQVIGTSGDQTLNPACKLIMTWQDGSSFELIKDLADGELYILLVRYHLLVLNIYFYILNIYLNNNYFFYHH